MGERGCFSAAAVFGFMLLIIVSVAIWMECSTEKQVFPKLKQKTCSICGMVDPHHANNCPYKQ